MQIRNWYRHIRKLEQTMSSATHVANKSHVCNPSTKEVSWCFVKQSALHRLEHSIAGITHQTAQDGLERTATVPAFPNEQGTTEKSHLSSRNNYSTTHPLFRCLRTLVLVIVLQILNRITKHLLISTENLNKIIWARAVLFILRMK